LVSLRFFVFWRFTPNLSPSSISDSSVFLLNSFKFPSRDARKCFCCLLPKRFFFFPFFSRDGLLLRPNCFFFYETFSGFFFFLCFSSFFFFLEEVFECYYPPNGPFFCLPFTRSQSCPFIGTPHSFFLSSSFPETSCAPPPVFGFVLLFFLSIGALHSECEYFQFIPLSRSLDSLGTCGMIYPPLFPPERRESACLTSLLHRDGFE